MKTIVTISAAILATACTSSAPPQPSARAQSELAAALAGRTAEPVRSCVSLRDLGGNRSIGEGAILFKGRTSKVVYVNRPPGGCPELGLGRAMKLRTISTQLCAGEIIEVFDPFNGVSYGACGLGEFTPYRRAG